MNGYNLDLVRMRMDVSQALSLYLLSGGERMNEREKERKRKREKEREEKKKRKKIKEREGYRVRVRDSQELNPERLSTHTIEQIPKDHADITMCQKDRQARGTVCI
jgi:hypothetical protein